MRWFSMGKKDKKKKDDKSRKGSKKVKMKKVTYMFPKKLHKELKKHCIDINKSMNEFVIALVKKALNSNSNEDYEEEE
jgi:predicted HicB family RNase H-like nuclease